MIWNILLSHIRSDNKQENREKKEKIKNNLDDGWCGMNWNIWISNERNMEIAAVVKFNIFNFILILLLKV